jgi:DNA-3-methyladenine glycosylase II
MPDASDLPHHAVPLLWRDDRGPVVDRRAALAHLASSDPTLGTLVRRAGPFRLEPPPAQTPFQYLLRCITAQQLSGRAATTIFGRVAAIYRPRRFPAPRAVLATPAERLRAAGLSTAKSSAILDLARHAAAGRIPGRRRLGVMTPEAIHQRLTAVRGIGRWTVEMLLIFYLGHPDVLPVHDLGVRKGFARAFRKRALPEPAALARYGERWRPYRSIASWYLWRALELPPD